MPYSVSVPITRRTLMSCPPRASGALYCPARLRALLTRCLPSSLLRRSSVQTAPRPLARRCVAHSLLQPNAVTDKAGMRTRFPEGEQASKVLPGVRHGVDRTACLGTGLAGDQGPDVDDALALLAGDAGPVVRVGGVRQVLVL